MIADTPPAAATRERGLGWLLVTALLVAGAAVVLVGIFTPLGTSESDKVGSDFRAVYYVAGEAVVDGRSPYPADPNDPALDERTVYAYPPQLALLVAPLSLLPIDVASVIAVLALVASLLGALALVGVRDVRCYAAAILWAPAWNTFETANVSGLLVLGLAVAWRLRSTLWPFAAALGVLVSLKLFLWPVVVWAGLTKSVRAAAAAVLCGLAVTFLAWAAIGFPSLDTYADVLDRVATQESYSIRSMAIELGLGSTVGTIMALLVTGAMLGLCVTYARRGDERHALAAAVFAALAVSPIVWLHYLVLLLVPLGLLRPRFSAIWLVPLVLWISPRAGTGDGIEPYVPALVVAALAILLFVPPFARPQRSAAEAV